MDQVVGGELVDVLLDRLVAVGQVHGAAGRQRRRHRQGRLGGGDQGGCRSGRRRAGRRRSGPDVLDGAPAPSGVGSRGPRRTTWLTRSRTVQSRHGVGSSHWSARTALTRSAQASTVRWYSVFRSIGVLRSHPGPPDCLHVPTGAPATPCPARRRRHRWSVADRWSSLSRPRSRRTRHRWSSLSRPRSRRTPIGGRACRDHAAADPSASVRREQTTDRRDSGDLRSPHDARSRLSASGTA